MPKRPFCASVVDQNICNLSWNYPSQIKVNSTANVLLNDTNPRIQFPQKNLEKGYLQSEFESLTPNRGQPILWRAFHPIPDREWALVLSKPLIIPLSFSSYLRNQNSYKIVCYTRARWLRAPTAVSCAFWPRKRNIWQAIMLSVKNYLCFRYKTRSKHIKGVFHQRID